MNQNNPKKNLYFDPHLTAPPEASILNSHKPALYFQKYFPKYLRNFSLRANSYSVKSMLKKTKVIRNPQICLSSDKSSELGGLLASKAKVVKTLTYENQSPTEFLTEIKLFTSLTSIRFFLPERPSYGQDHEYFPRRAFKKTKSLKQLKHLKFSNLLRHHANFIMQLNDASPRLLSSLKTISLSCVWRGGRDVELLEYLKPCKNLLRKITCLHLGSLCSSSHQNNFQSLVQDCSNLSHLSFEFSCRDMYYQPGKGERYSFQCFPIKMNYLSAVETLQNLKSLELYIADLSTFFKDFVAPPSVQNLLLNFKESLSKETMHQIDQKFSNAQAWETFEENKTLVKFYEHFGSLPNLETLRILFSFDPQHYKYQNYLLQNILKRTRSLKNLTFTSPKSKSSVADLYFPQLLESCHHFSEALQTLEFGNEKLVFSNFGLSSSRNKFTNLATVIIIGRFDDPETDFYFFLEQIASLGDSIKTIKLNTTVNCNVKFLLAILQQLNQIKRPSSLKIELQVRFKDPGLLQDLKVGYENVMGELFLGNQENWLQGVFLHLRMNKIFVKYLKELWPVFRSKFEGFRLEELDD